MSHARTDVEALIKMVKLLQSNVEALAYDDPEILKPMDKALEALVPEEKVRAP